MRYQYTKYINDLKDLKHIEWFVSNSDGYEFHSEKSQELLEKLKNNIRKKNIFYSEIIRDYNELVREFDNNPYNYKYDVIIEEGKNVKSDHYNYYFIEVQDRSGNDYIVPYQYILDNPTEHKLSEVQKSFSQKMRQKREKVLENLASLAGHYYDYWENGGVKDAIIRYEAVRYGKDYRLLFFGLGYILYNFLLIRIMHEAQFFRVITHFWQILSSKPEATYSAINVFSGHRYLGTIAIICIIYFLIMDYYYTYGLYYTIYINKKYNEVRKHHDKVAKLYEKFYDDYSGLNQSEMIEDRIKKLNHRNSVYIPLAEKVSRRYNFYVEKIIKVNGDINNKEKRKVFQSVYVPKKTFYTQPLKSRILWILVFLIFIQAICSPEYLIYY